MEQKTTTTPPQWVEDMQKWQKEDTEHRSVICVATDKCDVYSILGGYSLPLVMALLANTIQSEAYDEIVEGVFLTKNLYLIPISEPTRLLRLSYGGIRG